MKAMVLDQPGPVETAPLRLREVPVPEPGPGEIRLRVEACGLCHTDLHVLEGELPPHRQPLILGHQVVGVVDKMGEGVTGWSVGQRAGVPWLNRACGSCEFCRSDRENLCESGRFTGYDADGGLAEYLVQHGDWAYPVPGDYSPLQAAPLLCAGIIGYRALRLSEVKPGQRLGLFGFGASAHVTIQVARHLGCEVLAFTRGEHHRELALELGASWAGGLHDQPPHKIDGGIVFAPAGEVVPPALRVLNKGGTIALAGIYMSPIPELDYNQLLYHERTLRSVANSTRADCRELLELAPRIPIRTDVTEFPLDQTNQALRLLKQSQVRGAAVVRLT